MSPRRSGERDIRDLFFLDPHGAHLNHGSYGAVPRPVGEAARHAGASVETDPERFYRDDIHVALAVARSAAQSFLRYEPVALVTNVTEAAVVVFDALGLAAGAEIVLSDHAYPHVADSARRAAARAGATIRTVVLPERFDAEVIVERFAAAVNARTRLVVVDQITSASAWRLPVAAVIDAVAPIPVFVDGAHAPGLIEAPVPPGAAFWAGNFHKWAFSARTCAALTAAPEWRDRVRPLVHSADFERLFEERFDYQGTTDQSARLSLPAAIEFPATHLGCTWDELRAANHRVLGDGLSMLAATVGAVAEPDHGLSMRVVTLPERVDGPEAARLMTAWRAGGLSVAAFSVAGHLSVRLSAQCYVIPGDFERLAAAITALR